jgi:hypothetical protein
MRRTTTPIARPTIRAPREDTTFMTTQTYSGTSSTTLSGGEVAAFFLIVGVVVLLVMIPYVVGLWKVLGKAGRPGWGAIVPVYNNWLIIEIVGRPLWWLALLFVPYASFVILVILMVDLAKSFGKSAGFGVGLALLGPVFMPILGFGSATYLGPSVVQPTSGGPAAGWYPDPWRQAPQRYWDGRAWTPHTA